ncbi:MAG: hypothetical protein H6R37_1162, partial [Deltaproteobacteria bacterium]|nr:hypothetical protein [Deltaproteobacteria bacterium]
MERCDRNTIVRQIADGRATREFAINYLFDRVH